MPIKAKEKPFLPHFLGNTPEESDTLYKTFQTDLTMLSRKASILSGLDKEDLFQESVIGLARAARDFDEGRSEDFRIFAIYKIKDAIRDYIASQQKDIRVPQYISDAISLMRQLAQALKKGISLPDYLSLSEIWRISTGFRSEPSLEEDVERLRTSLKNLAVRTHTSVPELLERVEFMPTISIDITETVDADMVTDPETEVVSVMSNKVAIENLKRFLSKEDFKLLYMRFAEGYTYKELESEFGITEESLNVKVKKLISELAKRKGVIFNENSKTDNPITGKAGAAANGD